MTGLQQWAREHPVIAVFAIAFFSWGIVGGLFAPTRGDVRQIIEEELAKYGIYRNKP